MSGETGCYSSHHLLARGALDVLLKPFTDLAGLRQTLWEHPLPGGD
jgi:hypothetical protein